MKVFPHRSRQAESGSEKRDLPPALPLRMILGPSVVLLGLGLGSGEFVLWPNLVAKYGFVCFWAAAVGLLTQFFINMEIERWTLATGESILSGFFRLSRAWAWVFFVFVAAPFIWPGWGAGAFKCLGFLTGGSHLWPTVAGLVGMGLILTASAKIYAMVERVQVGLIVFKVAALSLMTLPFISWDVLAEWAAGLANVGGLPEAADFDRTLFLSALAYAGLGGVGNLVQSNYIREKGFGMGHFSPKILGPYASASLAVPFHGFHFEGTEENLKRWRAWWKVANWEQFVSFFVLGLVTMSLLGWLAYATVFHHPELGTGVLKEFSFLELEGRVIGAQYGGGFRVLFYLIGFSILFTVQLGVLDLVSRLLTDVVKGMIPHAGDRWSDSRLYFTVLWTMIAAGVAILLGGFSQPRALLITGACINAVVMSLYALLLLYCNVTSFAPPVRPSFGRMAALVWAFGFYGYFSFVTFRGFW